MLQHLFSKELSPRVLTLALLCALATPTSAQTPVDAWKAPHLTLPAKDLYQAASTTAGASATGTDVAFLEDDESYTFDAQGRSHHVLYIAFKILTQQGASDWDSLSIRWEPWHQKKPALHARVISPDGSVHTLDPKTITEAADSDGDELTYSDAKQLKAPLPAIKPGVVVEEEFLLEETAPLFSGGQVSRDYFGRIDIPIEHSHLDITAPATVPIHTRVVQIPDLKSTRTEANGLVTLAFEHGPFEAIKAPRSFLPSDIASVPYIAFATGASWQQMATEYGKSVDAQLASQQAAADLKATIAPLLANATTRDQKIAALLNYLDREIRYTGIEFGEAAILPHSPTDTLARKYGDCKDKATLLVGLLRAAGIPAEVALLNAGSRYDVEPDLVGMGLFDHAIVHLPPSDSGPEYWIDATDDYARLGQLPADDQDRLALLIRTDTTTLTRTPQLPSTTNVLNATRTFALAENGPAHITEVLAPQGAFEDEFRGAYVDLKEKKTQEGLTAYVKDEFLADKLDHTQATDPHDLATPYALTLESNKAKRGYSDLANAVAVIRLGALIDRLPQELRTREPADKKDKDGNPEKPRTEDFQLPVAFVSQWTYHILPPPGFQSKPLPPNVDLPLGPAHLSEAYNSEPDGSVTALVRFDTVKRRLTAAEALAMRNAIADLMDTEAIVIGFEPKAEALLREGKVREALDSYRGLIALHPAEAVHHLQLANALLSAGLGEGARREANEAVRLEPKSAIAQKTLAEVLEFDLVGRKYRPGSDLAGAAKAYRAAIAIEAKEDPDNKATIANLAILLEYNAYGVRYAADAPLKESIATYRTLTTEKLAELALPNNLAFTLFYAQDFAASLTAAEALNPLPKALVVACQAALHGSPAALAEANKRSGTEAERQQVLSTAGSMLRNLRKYPLAADLLQAGASGENTANTLALANILRKAQLHEQRKWENTPQDAVLHYYELTLSPTNTLQKYQAVSSANLRQVLNRMSPENLQTVLSIGKQLQSQVARTGQTLDLTTDTFLQSIEPHTEGSDETGYRVILQLPTGKKFYYFVVKEKDRYLVLDQAGETSIPNALSLEVLDDIAAGKLDAAKTLLDWAREEMHLSGGDDPLAGFTFPRIWTKGAPADPNRMKLAAATLAASSLPTADQGMPILEAALPNASDRDKLPIQLSLLFGYNLQKNYAKLLPLAQKLSTDYPESKTAFDHLISALTGLNQNDQAEAACQQRLKQLPGDLDAYRALTHIAELRGNYPAARDWTQKLITLGTAEPNDLNSYAWDTLFFDKPTPEDLQSALQKATQSVQNSQQNPHIVHTLGCLYAATGQPRQAREVLVESMDKLNLDEPNDDYWYAFGRIAEDYGEHDLALSDYKKLTPPNDPRSLPTSSYHLAQQRLQSLNPK